MGRISALKLVNSTPTLSPCGPSGGKIGISIAKARMSRIPIITLLGLSLPGIFGGALITEAVFNYPGMGYLFYQAAGNSDYPVLLGITVVVAVATVVGSLLADILYAVLDPRVRYVNQ